ncbi:MAG: DUF6576 domain-containing protein [Bacteroidota bacterium]
MELTQQIKSFLATYKTAGWLMLFILGGLVTQGLLWMAIQATGSAEGTFETVLSYLILPAQIRDFIFKPWTLLTYTFFWEISSLNILRILIDGAFVWLFCQIYQQLLGDLAAKRVLILASPIIGLLTVLTWALIFMNGTQPGEGLSAFQYISGISPIMIFLAVACASFLPDFKIQLFLFGQVAIKWVVLILVLIEFMGAAFSPLGVAVAIAALLGYFHIYMYKRGTDIPELVWSYYQDNTSRSSTSSSRMRVKYGGRYTPKADESRKSQSQKSKGKIPQEIIDGLLDKISEKGYESLSREEKELLFKASSQKEDD